MLRRPPRPARALGALGLLFGSLTLAQPAARAEAPPADLAAETVSLLQAQKDGTLDVVARGKGDDRVQFHIKNRTDRRLNVVLPPGLIASAGAGQGFQSMGLSAPTSSSEGFGGFSKAENRDGGFRSVPVRAPQPEGLVVPPGQAVDLAVPSVCLNFGIATPTPRDVFTLVDVDDYTPDVRVRKALRSLATYGSSQSVAQAVMWHVANGMSFEQLAAQNVKKFNLPELTQAARIAAAVDATEGENLVDPSLLTRSRLVVRLQGEGLYYKDGKRLSSEVQGYRLLGLPVQVVDSDDEAPAGVGTLALTVSLAPAGSGKTAGRVLVRYNQLGTGWTRIGTAAFKEGAASELTGDKLAAAVDHAVAQALVNVEAIRRTNTATTLKINNRLPLTIANVVVRTGRDAAADSVVLDGLGISPGHSTRATVPAAGAVVERVELNGF